MALVVVCGAINWDTTCFVSHLPGAGEEVACDKVSEVSGGTGANVAVAASRLLDPDQTAMLGAVGQDPIGRTQLEILQQEGVSTEATVRLKDTESGHAYIFVDRAGQNVIASSLAANTSLGPQHIKSTTLGRLLDGCRCIAITDPPMAIAEMLISVAAQRQIPVLWDPGVLKNLRESPGVSTSEESPPTSCSSRGREDPPSSIAAPLAPCTSLRFHFTPWDYTR